ncbi:cadherin-1-like isoform X7 [Xiphophorus couchianus]|uniref:cadherin-1-like isoform X7 n=1 Tax=Xiphophorus couchianus TaxID=32473 RepID=UPI001016543D|nr:cadherin-1-like isoform X7 [Xiphophorus couchianus]
MYGFRVMNKKTYVLHRGQKCIAGSQEDRRYLSTLSNGPFSKSQASPAGRTEDQICEPGFDSESVIFKVTEKHLRPTTIVGKVNFTDCTDVTRLIFTTYDSHFYVETDGTVTVSRWLVLQEGQRRFYIHSWDSKGKKRTVSVVVQYQGDHDAAHSIQSDFPLKDITNNLEDAPQVPILYFPKSNPGLKRRKRGWVVPPLNVAENHRGPYPLALARIRSDFDKVKKIQYKITGPGADEFPVGLFTMDRNTGELYVTQELDREKQDKYMFQVHAVVDGSAPAEEPMEMIVNVIDQNDNKPVFVFLGNVAESSSIGSEVMKVTATDADEPNNDNSQISYRIVSQEPQQPNPSMFVINPTTGAISVNAAGLDRQKYPEYTLEVKAADMNGEGHSALTKVIISVTPGTELPAAQGGGRSRRDADPKIHHSSSEKMFLNLLPLPSEEGMRRRKRSWVIPPLSVPENSRGPFPLKLAQVRSDRSQVTKIIYRLRGPGADQPPVGLFIIDSDSGWLEVTQELDRENQDKYRLEALAVEEGQAEASESIEIIVNVIDQNDNKPVFSRDTFKGEVPQSSAKGFEVMTVQATDPDEENSDNSDVCYRIIRQEPEEPNPSMFAINTTTGLITVDATGLDREKHPQYTLTVVAADMKGEGLMGIAKVILTITDSSSPTGWVIPDITVPENGIGPFPLQLAQIRFNEDETKKILYSISGPGADQPPVGLFTMDGDAGHLYVTQGLDRENQDKYTLQVNAVAEDGGATVGQTQAVVKVTDQNDNKPVFNKDTYEGEVPEASPIGFEVIKVEATDADEPNTDHSEIRYSIISQEPAEPSMFTIDPVSGAITLSTDGLNREKHPQYTLLVRAEDSAGKGSTTLFEQVKVILTVTANSTKLQLPDGSVFSHFRDSE